MKFDLATSIIIAIVGTLASFFVCNLFFGEIKPFSVKTVENNVNADLETPDPNVFNYRALNPTVEVYVGSCVEYGPTGECLEQNTQATDDQVEDSTSDEENQSTDNDASTNNTNTNNSSNSNSNNTNSNDSNNARRSP